jgi:hypothetical protein
MKSKIFQSSGLLIEARKDWNGMYYIAWKPNLSMFFRVRADLIRWCGYSKGLPTRVALEEWLDQLTDQGVSEALPSEQGEPQASG